MTERVSTHLDVAKLSDEELFPLLAGASSWRSVGIDRISLPGLKFSDGPAGIRGETFFVGPPGASFPAGIALGSTWDPDLIRKIGKALGEEARSKGVNVVLAPTVNLHRSTLNGRNFECFSEDPMLTGELAAALIQGVQSQGVAATVKHLVGNESEFERYSISSEIDERTLREVYLLPFEVAVKSGGVWAVMAAYNKLNGTFCTEHRWLLDQVLRKEWGFDGLVMSDWFATHSAAQSIAAGLDLEMPGPPRERTASALAASLASGTLDPESIRASAERLVRLADRAGPLDSDLPDVERSVDLPHHRSLIRRAGAAGTVLLKNDGILPLSEESKPTIGVIGPNAATARIMGGGSAQLVPHYAISPLDALRDIYGSDSVRGYAIGATNNRFEPLLPVAMDWVFFNNAEFEGDPALFTTLPGTLAVWIGAIHADITVERFSAGGRFSFVPDATGTHRVGLSSVGLCKLYLDGQLLLDAWTDWKEGSSFFGMGCDEIVAEVELIEGTTYEFELHFLALPSAAMSLRGVRVGLSLPTAEADMLAAVDLACEVDVPVLFVGSNAEWDREGSDRTSLGLPGRQDELISRVAAINPRTVVVLQTGAPVEMPWLKDVAAVLQSWFPGQECGNAIADVLLGRADPGGRLPQTFPMAIDDDPAAGSYPGASGKVEYREGVFVGYRRYEGRGIRPLFPFGYGLSYTQFEVSQARLQRRYLAPGESVSIQFEVKNVGKRSGSEVVQLYVHDVACSVKRPRKELRAFAKVQLDPGESETVSLALCMRDFAYFDESGNQWKAEAGTFRLLIGRSSADIYQRLEIKLAADWCQSVGEDRRYCPQVGNGSL